MLLTAVALDVPRVILKLALTSSDLASRTNTRPFALPVYTYSPRRSITLHHLISDSLIIVPFYSSLLVGTFKILNSWRCFILITTTHRIFYHRSILCMYYLKIYLHMKVNIFNKLNLLDFKYTILFDITCMFIHLYVKI